MDRTIFSKGLQTTTATLCYPYTSHCPLQMPAFVGLGLPRVKDAAPRIFGGLLTLD